jgi:hypothetical protein
MENRMAKKQPAPELTPPAPEKPPAPVTRNITWESVRRELNSTRNDQGAIDYDKVRKQKLAALSRHTCRPAVLYATDFLNENKIKHVQNAISINFQDVRGLAEVVRGLQGDSLDLILHSPGGSPEAAESIVAVLRNQFKTVRVLVPVMAKSAATMIALSANEVLMPISAELGPIDPQFLLSDGRGGQRMTPAQAIIDDVQRAKQAVINKQADFPVWVAQIQGQPPGLYQQALNAVDLSKKLVKRWIEQYMLTGEATASQQAQVIVDYLGNHNQFLSHARRVDVQTLNGMGAKIYDITTKDRELWELLEELWYVVEHTFQNSMGFKMWENSNGVGLHQVLQPQMIFAPMTPPGAPSP